MDGLSGMMSAYSIPPQSVMMKTALFLLASLLVQPFASAQGIEKFNFEIETLGGRKLTQNDFENNVLLVDFWGTWCGPCRKAIPSLMKLYKKYKHHGLEIIGLNYREEGPKSKQLATVRDFASKHGIPYPLALGTKKIKNQVVGLNSYPTMLFFKKGLEFDHLKTGFDPAEFPDVEKWIRKELGLDTKKGESEPEEEEEPEEEKLKLAAGVIYKPGNHDKGFDFTVKGLDDKEVQFADLRGKKVVLALTSTWDHEAANTVVILNKLKEQWSDKAHVIAASLEMKTDRADQITAIKAFASKHKPTYPILPAGLKFLKKVHLPEGVPLFLVFDAEGTLVLRQRSNTKAKVLKAINAALETKARP